MKVNYIKRIEKEKTSNIYAFSALNTPEGKFQFFKSLNGIDANLTFINSQDNDWYQRGIPGVNDDIASCARFLLKNQESSYNICIGSSMGGYGAGLYAIEINADVAIIFGSEFKIGFPFSRSKLHMPGNIKIDYGDLYHIINSRQMKTQFFVFVGDADIIDLYNATLVAGSSNVHLYNIRKSGHNVTKYITENICSIKDLISSAIVGKKQVDILFDGHLSFDIKENKVLIAALYDIYVLFRQRDFFVALDKIEIIKTQISLTTELYNLYYGMLLIRIKMPARALPYLNRAFKLNELSRDVNFELGMALNHVGDTNQAIYHYSNCINIESTYSPAYHHLGLIYKSLGDLHSAERCLRQAATIGNNVRYNKDLISVLKESILKLEVEVKSLESSLQNTCQREY